MINVENFEINYMSLYNKDDDKWLTILSCDCPDYCCLTYTYLDSLEKENRLIKLNYETNGLNSAR